MEQKFLEFMGLKKRPDISLKSKVKVPNEMWKLYCKWSDDNYKNPLKNDVDNVRLVDQEGEPSISLRKTSLFLFLLMKCFYK